MLHIVLVEPEIPPNTGNVARMCAGIDAHLHLVGKLGFDIDDRAVKRAGLDYWHHVRVSTHPDLDTLAASHPEMGCWWFTSAHAERLYTEVTYDPNAVLVFGKETAGLPRDLLERCADRTIRIPHWGQVRSLNLSNAVAVIAYEAMRQLHAAGAIGPPIARMPDRPAGI